MNSDDLNPDDPNPDDLNPDDPDLDDPNPDDLNPDDPNPDDPNPDDPNPDGTHTDIPTSGTEPENTTPDNAEPDDTTMDMAEPNNTTANNLTSVAPEESTPTTSDEDPMITPALAAQEGATPLPHSVLVPTPITTSTTPARTFEHDHSYPGFITPAVVEHFNSVDGGLRWVEMVKSYLALEGQYRLRVSCYSTLTTPST